MIQTSPSKTLAVLMTTLTLCAGSAQAGERDFPAGYQSWNGCAKQEYLWADRLEPSRYRSLPAVGGGWSNLLSSISSLIFLDQTFDHSSDAMPGSRQKVIHSHGSVAKVRMSINSDSPFSGVFAPGESCGLIRLSLAGPESSVGFTPGMALKVMIDGRPSVNFHVMHSLNGQDENRNFFAHTFTNSLPAPRGFVLRSLEFTLGIGGRSLRHLPINHGAVTDTTGRRAVPVRAPGQIAFVPLQKNRIAADSSADFRVDLATIPGDSPLYAIHGLDADRNWVYIGELQLTSGLVASEFGDRHLFFRHGE